MKMTRKALGVSLLALAAAGFAGYAAGQVHQPHMQHALSDLQNAESELNVATRDKAGHRARAVQLVDQAIGEVRAGMVAGEQNAERRPR